jgi:hypothetical protein
VTVRRETEFHLFERIRESENPQQIGAAGILWGRLARMTPSSRIQAAELQTDVPPTHAIHLADNDDLKVGRILREANTTEEVGGEPVKRQFRILSVDEGHRRTPHTLRCECAEERIPS